MMTNNHHGNNIVKTCCIIICNAPIKTGGSFEGRGSTCVFFMIILRWIYNKKTEVALYYQ